MIPHSCPVCHGTGVLPQPFQRADSTAPAPPCRPCGGRGVVFAPEDMDKADPVLGGVERLRKAL